MSDEERATRGVRDQRKPRTKTNATVAWGKRAERLEKLGLAMIERASRAPTTKTPSNGVQINAKLSAGLKLLEAADRIWIRLGRVGPPTKGGEGAPDKPVDALEEFRRRRSAPAP